MVGVRFTQYHRIGQTPHGSGARLSGLEQTMTRFLSLFVAAFAASAAFAQTAPPAPAPILTNAARFHPVVARNGMVASQEKRANRVGVDILRARGNGVGA